MEIGLVLHCKKVSRPSRDVTYQTLPGREQFNYSRPGRVWKVTSHPGRGQENRYPFFIVYCFHELIRTFKLLPYRTEDWNKREEYSLGVNLEDVEDLRLG